MFEVFSLHHIVVLTILAIAVFFDLQRRQVPNRLVVVSFIICLSLNFFNLVSVVFGFRHPALPPHLLLDFLFTS